MPQSTPVSPEDPALVIHADPASDQVAVRRCLGNFGTGVTIMTTMQDGVTYGMTANSFSTVSLDPPMILWSVTRNSNSAAAFLTSKHFAVNILAADQGPLCRVFAKSGPDKFAGVDWQPGLGGAPILDGAVATLECRTLHQVEGGDHIVLFGRIERMRSTARDPLLFVQGRFATAAEQMAQA